MPDGDKFYWCVRGAGSRRLRSDVAGVAQHALAQQLVLPAPVVADRLIALYQRHCAEWYQFPASSLAQLHRKAA